MACVSVSGPRRWRLARIGRREAVRMAAGHARRAGATPSSRSRRRARDVDGVWPTGLRRRCRALTQRATTWMHWPPRNATAFGQPQPRDRRTPAWLLSPLRRTVASMTDRPGRPLARAAGERACASTLHAAAAAPVPAGAVARATWRRRQGTATCGPPERCSGWSRSVRSLVLVHSGHQITLPAGCLLPRRSRGTPQLSW